MNDSFSVAMSVYKNDEPDYFDRSLNSITDSQTIKPTEIIFVVDGPVPDSINTIISKYQKKYSLIKVIRQEKNQGLGKALRKAIESCSYNLIARMDSDDVSVPMRFEEQLRFFKEHPDIDVLGGDITEFIGDEKNIIAKRTVPCVDSIIKQYLRVRCPFNHMSVMYKKNSVLNAGGYQDWFCNEDYYLWIRMFLKNAKFANTGTVLVNVRTGADMYSRRGGMKYYQSEYKLQKYMLQKKVIGLPIYVKNVIERFILQVLLPNTVRGWVFRHFARESI